mmetsp:Transcript_30410/g.87123  ORF Transcript_30410/g.87123 Transcript_30410/m.87123 type:complete len:440 (+) Transcript_30410:431-1750(+)
MQLLDSTATTAPTPSRSTQRQRQSVRTQHRAHKRIIAIDWLVYVDTEQEVGCEALVLRNSGGIGSQAAECPHSEVLCVPLHKLRQRLLHLGGKQRLDTVEVDAVVPNLDLPDAAHEARFHILGRLPDVHAVPLDWSEGVALGLRNQLVVDVDPQHPSSTHGEQVRVSLPGQPATRHLQHARPPRPLHGEEQHAGCLIVGLLLGGRRLDVDAIKASFVGELEHPAAPAARPREGEHGGEGEFRAEERGDAKLPQVQARALAIECSSLACNNWATNSELHENHALGAQLGRGALQLLKYDPVLSEQTASDGHIGVKFCGRLCQAAAALLDHQVLDGFAHLGASRSVCRAILVAALPEGGNGAGGAAGQLEGEGHLPTREVVANGLLIQQCPNLAPRRNIDRPGVRIREPAAAAGRWRVIMRSVVDERRVRRQHIGAGHLEA